MKTTGVTRKIDELGRIVIPKEIRRNLSIRDGENLEIFIDDDAICLKKHYQIHSFLEIGKKLINLLSSLIDVEIYLTDREKVVCSNIESNIVNKNINSKLINLIDERENYFSENSESLNFENEKIEGYFSIVPIISSMDSLGLVIFKTPRKEDYKILIKFMAKILADKVDIC